MSENNLTKSERNQLIHAVERWQDFGAAWYVDHYVVPAVERILHEREESPGDSIAATAEPN